MSEIQIPKRAAQFLKDNEIIISAIFWSYVKKKGPGVLIIEDGVKGSFKTRFSDYESIRPDEQGVGMRLLRDGIQSSPLSSLGLGQSTL